MIKRHKFKDIPTINHFKEKIVWCSTTLNRPTYVYTYLARTLMYFILQVVMVLILSAMFFAGFAVGYFTAPSELAV